MILITVGAQMPFPRLVGIVDEWAEQHPEAEVTAQIGDQDVAPKHIVHMPLVGPDKLREMIRDAEVVVAHAGMGTIITCLDLGTPLILFPREGARRETRNDHQVATVQRFSDRQGIWASRTSEELCDLLDRRSDLATQTPTSPETSATLLHTIREFIDA